MNVAQEQIRVTFCDMTRINVLFELKHNGIVVATEEGHQARSVGRIPEDGEPWERDLHEWCAEYVHTHYDGVLMTESTASI